MNEISSQLMTYALAYMAIVVVGIVMKVLKVSQTKLLLVGRKPVRAPAAGPPSRENQEIIGPRGLSFARVRSVHRLAPPCISSAALGAGPWDAPHQADPSPKITVNIVLPAASPKAELWLEVGQHFSHPIRQAVKENHLSVSCAYPTRKV